MESHRTTPAPSRGGLFARRAKHLSKSATAWVGGAAKRVSGKTLPWCRDHILSIAVLLTFPVAMGAFYWNRDTPELTPLPDYLAQFQNGEAKMGRVALPKIEEAPLTSVVPEASAGGEPPRLLNFDDSTDERGFGFPQPLPGAVDFPERTAQEHRGSALPGRANVSTGYPAEHSLRECVWLTGSIEPLEAEPDLIQNASSGQEWTPPARN